MRTKTIGFALCAVLFALCGSVDAQQPKKIFRIGYLAEVDPATDSARAEAIRLALRELGYIEGQNIAIEYRYAAGKVDRFPELAAELVRLKVAIIVSNGGLPTRAAKAATSTIPIVMTNDPDPVGTGVVASLARPGGNITGLSTFAPELSSKRLEILREVVPKLSRVAILVTSTSTSYALMSKEIDLAAKALKVQLQNLDVLRPKDIGTAFRAAIEERADAVLVLPGPILGAHRAEVVELAAKNRLPVMYHQSLYTEAGGLMYYGVNILDRDRRAATYVDKILKGAKPVDLPVEQPTKFEFVINVKTAKQIGVMIPPDLLARATKIIR